MTNVTADWDLEPFPDIFRDYRVQIRMYPACSKRVD